MQTKSPAHTHTMIVATHQTASSPFCFIQNYRYELALHDLVPHDNDRNNNIIDSLPGAVGATSSHLSSNRCHWKNQTQ